MLEMPSIESDFPVLGGVDFNLLFCYESPEKKQVVHTRYSMYTGIQLKVDLVIIGNR
jgi:hypothetical protein